MGGELTAESKPGAGSTFRFEAPFAVAEAARPSRRSRAAIPPATRVLVVDDNATNREIVRGYVSGRVLCDDAAGGAEALGMLEVAAAAGRAYDLVVLDAQMPESRAPTSRARSAGPRRSPARAIVMLTSAGASGETSADDVDCCLTKPVRRAALLTVLAEVLSGETAAVAAAPEAAPAAEHLGRVLVAEDNPVNQVVIEALLRKRGVAVDIVEDGLEAVRRLDREIHDAVFMDCQMPKLDGYEATARIRADEPDGRRIPIVAMTAHAFEGDRERCLRAGMDDYISKPIRAAELDPVLERWLAGPAAAGESPAGLVDVERIRSIHGASANLVEKLVQVFARTTPELLDELRAAVERGDDEERRRLAHKLRGSSEAVGAQRLSALAHELEHGTGDPSEAVAGLRPAYDGTLEELRQIALPASRA